ncbi:MAG: exonuclease SbcCD subunit D [Chromatocurvus sp.]
MALTFIHTSDWQIGKVFGFVEEQTMGLLQRARLDAIDRIGRLAEEHGARHVLVAGDVYDTQDVTQRLLLQPIERMRAFNKVTWHLLPGNHDPDQPFGIWDRLKNTELPDNIEIHADAEPYIHEADRIAILPAPLKHFRSLDDLTAYMDKAETPDGYYRIGLAHGSIRSFGSDESQAANFIDPRRPELAALSYLALGDWHGTQRINERVWYSGTHEIDGYDVLDGGKTLVVTLDRPDAIPTVEKVVSGTYHWHREEVTLGGRSDIDALAERLRALAPAPLSNHLVRLRVSGTLSLEDSAYFESLVHGSVDAALAQLRIDNHILPMPSEDDLATFGPGGFVRLAADRLMAMAGDEENDERELAALALQRLYVEYRALDGAGA